MLKEYHDRALLILHICPTPIGKTDLEALPDLLQATKATHLLNQIQTGAQISSQQKSQMLDVIKKWAIAFSAAPRRTNLALHQVETHTETGALPHILSHLQPVDCAPSGLPTSGSDRVGTGAISSIQPQPTTLYPQIHIKILHLYNNSRN